MGGQFRVLESKNEVKRMSNEARKEAFCYYCRQTGKVRWWHTPINPCAPNLVRKNELTRPGWSFDALAVPMSLSNKG